MSALFQAINGIIYNLKGLRMYTNQLASWHLINMGSPKDFNSVHFHGQTFLHKKTTSYRQAVYPLLPGWSNLWFCFHVFRVNPFVFYQLLRWLLTVVAVKWQNVFAGSFATLEMYPSKPGLWQLETEVGFNQEKGMQTLFLVLADGNKKLHSIYVLFCFAVFCFSFSILLLSTMSLTFIFLQTVIIHWVWSQAV